MVQNEIKIAIIMPLYRSKEISKKTFEMIKAQTARNNIVLYLINDCSPNTDCEYQDIIQYYSQYVEIKYFKTEENSGPGVARQIALDQCTENYIIFHDDDDYFYDEYAVERCINLIKENKDEKIAAIGFSYMVEYDDIRQPYYLINDKYWNNQNVLYYKDFLNKHNIKMNIRISYQNEDMPFHFLVPLYAEIDNYSIIYQKDTFLKTIHHDKTYTSITYTDDSHKEERKKILYKQYLYYTIESAEFILMYKNIISKHKKLTENEQYEIIKILKSFYKYCNSILFLLENNKYFTFKEKEIQNFKESCDFLLDLIDKNSKKVIEMIEAEEETEWEIHYTPIMFQYFKETYKERCHKLKSA